MYFSYIHSVSIWQWVSTTTGCIWMNTISSMKLRALRQSEEPVFIELATENCKVISNAVAPNVLLTTPHRSIHKIAITPPPSLQFTSRNYILRHMVYYLKMELFKWKKPGRTLTTVYFAFFEKRIKLIKEIHFLSHMYFNIIL